MHTYRELVSAFRKLGLDGSRPAIAHASLRSFWYLRGGAQALVGALLDVTAGLLAPTFTYKTMVVPEVGPPDNGLVYGGMADANSMAEFFTPEMPADPLMGVAAETLRRHPQARRSQHPILSFAAVGLPEVLAAQSYSEPLAPIRLLAEMDGWALLLGVNHTANTSIHLGERLAGRRSFIRWALTPQAIRECPGFPPCSSGFETLSPFLTRVGRKIQVGQALIQAIPLGELIDVVRALVENDPLALLCGQAYCPRCEAVRRGVGAQAQAI